MRVVKWSLGLKSSDIKKLTTSHECSLGFTFPFLPFFPFFPLLSKEENDRNSLEEKEFPSFLKNLVFLWPKRRKTKRKEYEGK